MNKAIKYIIAKIRIPKGMYCTGCPYFRPNIAPIKMGDGNMAYCKYLDKTDLDLCSDREDWEYKDQDDIIYSGKDLQHLGFVSLLWDGCKECGINDK